MRSSPVAALVDVLEDGIGPGFECFWGTCSANTPATPKLVPEPFSNQPEMFMPARPARPARPANRRQEQLQRQLSAAKRAGIKGVMAWKPGGFVRCVRPETEQTANGRSGYIRGWALFFFFGSSSLWNKRS